MKKIQTKFILIGITVFLGSVFLNVVSPNAPRAAAADDATTYCSATYGAKSDAEASDPKLAAADKARYDACVQGYQKAVCPDFPETGGVSSEDLGRACDDGRNTAATASGSTKPGSSDKCSTAILPKSLCDKGSGGGVWGILLLVLNILTAGVGIAAVGGFVFVAIMYTTGGDSPERIKKAKDMIVNIVIGLIAYGLIYALLNFIIPGGVFQ